MAKNQTTLVGRTVTLDFHSWNLEMSQAPTRAEKLRDLVGGGSGIWRETIQYDGQQGEITQVNPEGGYDLLMPNGRILAGVPSVMFSVLPKKPEPNAWEYFVCELPATPADRNAGLNGLGKEGWELVTEVPGMGMVRCTFKRRCLAK